MSDLVIETKKLTKIYGEQTAVNSVNLHVKPGRIYGLLGRNGAGKTTIMKMILGLTPIPYWSHHRNSRFLSESDRHRKP